jgi:hypothetical protein
MSTAHEGIVPFRGYRTWYQVVGELSAAGGQLPLLVLHGGPASLMTTWKISRSWLKPDARSFSMTSSAAGNPTVPTTPPCG